MAIDRLVLCGRCNLAKSTTNHIVPSPRSKPKYGGKCTTVINRGRRKEKRHKEIINHSTFPNRIAFSTIYFVLVVIDLPINKELTKKTTIDGINV